jgi:hypothetical protein
MDLQAFETTVRSHHPHKWMAKDYTFITHEELVFAMDTHGECQLGLADKYRIASHIFNVTHGCVIKDSDGLFINKTPTIVTDWSMMCDEAPKHQIPKCICGSKSVGSNRHSQWCEIKEN